MKMAPVINSLIKNGEDVEVVHTGQHYDKNMSQSIIEQLNINEPDYHLGETTGSHAEQTAKIMVGFENICKNLQPYMVIVAGDVNSTLACALVAVKLNIKVAHVESGLRSDDRSMPEEINRIVTDHIADILFTTEHSANDNLINEGIPEEKIHFVGNCMIDSLLSFITFAKEKAPWRKYGFEGKDYILVTLHRPSNVDKYDDLKKIIDMLNKISNDILILFPAHPRTRKNIDDFGLTIANPVSIIQPLSYIEFLGLLSSAKLVLTDSGGIQEETTMLNIPCLTLRENTERPVTVEKGTNVLVGTDPEYIIPLIKKIMKGENKTGLIPPLWDGKSAKRISEIISKL